MVGMAECLSNFLAGPPGVGEREDAGVRGGVFLTPSPVDGLVLRMYDHPMERLSLSLPEDLAARIRDAAHADGATLSAWLARAAESRLLLRNASLAIADWEREHGDITDDELAAVERAWRE